MIYKCGWCGSRDIQIKVTAYLNPNNGIDPATINPEDLPDTMEVAMGKNDKYWCWPCKQEYPMEDMRREEG